MQTTQPCGHTPATGDETLPSREQIERTAELFRALGDPERLSLLVKLGQAERCVSELVGEDDNFSTVSARLHHLLRARLVLRRRESKHMYYRLADEHVVRMVRDALDHADEP